MEKKLSNNDEAIVYAYKLGYRAYPDGTVISHKGKPVGYPRADGRHIMCLHLGNGKRITILKSRFIAYQLYGDKIFEKGIIVRHLDDTLGNNSFDNISIGTHLDNMNDRRRNGYTHIGCKRRYDYSKVYRYYHKNGYTRTIKKFNTNSTTLANILKSYTPTIKDKIAIWLGR